MAILNTFMLVQSPRLRFQSSEIPNVAVSIHNFHRSNATPSRHKCHKIFTFHPSFHPFWFVESTHNSHNVTNVQFSLGKIQGWVNVLVEHHPTIEDMITKKYLKVMWNKSPGHLPTPEIYMFFLRQNLCPPGFRRSGLGEASEHFMWRNFTMKNATFMVAFIRVSGNLQ